MSTRLAKNVECAVTRDITVSFYPKLLTYVQFLLYDTTLPYGLTHTHGNTRVQNITRTGSPC